MKKIVTKSDRVSARAARKGRLRTAERDARLSPGTKRWTPRNGAVVTYRKGDAKPELPPPPPAKRASPVPGTTSKERDT